MLSNCLEVCPLWLLFKCHKGWTWRSGKPPPTRPVAGGNSGMNYALSELVSWVLEPVASSIKGSSELISCEDLKSKVDQLNIINKSWVPSEDMVGKIANREEMITSNIQPKTCDCKHGMCEYDDCVDDYIPNERAGAVQECYNPNITPPNPPPPQKDLQHPPHGGSGGRQHIPTQSTSK